jgi:hypothetical protein
LPELDGQVHHDTHVIPMGNYVIEVGKSLIRSPSQVGNYKIVHKLAGLRYCPGDPRHSDVDLWQREITVHGKGRYLDVSVMPTSV